MKKAKSAVSDNLWPEYSGEDWEKSVQDKYFTFCEKDSNLTLVSPDVANVFPSSEADYEALRNLLELTEQSRKLTGHTGGRIETSQPA